MLERTETLLQAGCPVVTDAVFDTPERRTAVERLAQDLGVPFDGLWLYARPEVLRHRVETRKNTASDANARVLNMQLARDLGDMKWREITTSDSLEDTVRHMRDVLNV